MSTRYVFYDFITKYTDICIEQMREAFANLLTFFQQNTGILRAPVVQSIVSLTSSLRGQLIKCFTTL